MRFDMYGGVTANTLLMMSRDAAPPADAHHAHRLGRHAH
jgi:hypothetical protein